MVDGRRQRPMSLNGRRYPHHLEHDTRGLEGKSYLLISRSFDRGLLSAHSSTWARWTMTVDRVVYQRDRPDLGRAREPRKIELVGKGSRFSILQNATSQTVPTPMDLPIANSASSDGSTHRTAPQLRSRAEDVLTRIAEDKTFETKGFPSPDASCDCQPGARSGTLTITGRCNGTESSIQAHQLSTPWTDRPTRPRNRECRFARTGAHSQKASSDIS